MLNDLSASARPNRANPFYDENMQPEGMEVLLGTRKMLPTKIQFATSNLMMRTALAFMMALAFGVIPTLCPATACPLGTDFGASSELCCHEPKPQQPTSCPRTTIQDCPYLIL